jgi:UDP-glucose 4-epimerase
MTIMITGGAGYIGSHTCVELIRAGHSVVVLENFCNSQEEALKRIRLITGVAPVMVRGDVRDRELVQATLEKYQCSAVIHFAGLKAVGDSVARPVEYYDNNFVGSLRLVEAMQNAKVRKLVFSSSATVYGEPLSLPFKEDHSLLPVNPYGQTKLMVEQMLSDLAASDSSFEIAILRYFNPVGSHESGLIGEDPRGVPNNLMPFIAQVASGRRPHVNVFGKDYDTPDGTGIRDYIHVTDLAEGHLKALNHLDRERFFKVNLGTGRGTSVIELVQAFSKACGKDIPLVYAPRREGDIACFYACPDLAERMLGWRAERSLAEMCSDVWRWQNKNPEGYGSPR